MKNISFLFVVFFSLFFSTVTFAEISSKSQTDVELSRALQINQRHETKARILRTTEGQPALETDRFQYLLLNGDDKGIDNLSELQETFASNLPSDMKLVVVSESSIANTIKNKFLQWIPADRLIVASGKDLGDTVWARDSYPYPVYKDAAKTVELVAHKYFRFYNANQLIAQSVKTENVLNVDFVAVGGNLMAAANGDCFIVDSPRSFGLSDISYKADFRCGTVTRLPWLAGIGDVDEVIKVLPNNVILTNQIQYVKTLEDLGYKVEMLPVSKTGNKRTYANSVIINKTVFMPIFDDKEDLEAQAVYEKFGYKVIGIHSNYLSDRMQGSLHCLTMAYPPMNQERLLKSLGLSAY